MEKNNKPKGLKISVFNAGIVILSCLLYICLLTATSFASRNYEQLVMAADDYIQLEDAAKDILRASDYLTEQVRLYVQTLDPRYARLYFAEADVTRRRENALGLMREHSLDSSREISLETAVQLSNELMIREIYAIKLVSVAQGHPQTDISAQIDAVILDDTDQFLNPTQMIDKARVLLYDQYYQDMKSEIYNNLDYFTRGVLDTTESSLVNGLDSLSRSIRTQRLLLCILIVLNAVTFLVITLLVVKPLKVYLRCVQERSLFKVMGAYEFRYLAQVYNDVYTRSDSLAASAAFLRSRAEHDGLTSILNRYMFHEVCDLLRSSTSPLILILVDVDKFKDVNDTYGHIAGDRVLIRVANLLKECFRESDYVFRIGGDEFAAILPTVKSNSCERIREKLLQVNERLNHPDSDDIPVSLSMGVASSCSGYHDKLFEQADRAMYVVKENGRNGCLIYSEEMSAQ